MATLININGMIVNLDNVQAIMWTEEDPGLYLEFGDHSKTCALTDYPAARDAWAWLQSACVATFPVEDEETSA